MSAERGKGVAGCARGARRAERFWAAQRIFWGLLWARDPFLKRTRRIQYGQREEQRGLFSDIILYILSKSVPALLIERASPSHTDTLKGAELSGSTSNLA